MPFTDKPTDTWTGLRGEADQIVRNTGRKFWVFEGSDGLHVADNIEEANRLNEDYWKNPDTCLIAYIVMFAIDEEKAKELFYDAQDQWRAYTNGVEDFLGVVKIPLDSSHMRPEVGPVRGRTTDYGKWAKEMETRYGIAC